MADLTDCRRAARRYTDIHTDDAAETERLKADEVYGTLALARKELEVLQQYNDDISEDVDEAIDAAVEDIRSAMNEHAIDTVVLGDDDD